MTTKKKEDSLTIEDKLKTTLVPENEQPYQIPENWVWTGLEMAFDEVKEKTIPTQETDIAFIGLEHLQSGGGVVNKGDSQDVKSTKTMFRAGDVLYGKLRPYLNKHALVDFAGIASTDILVFRSKGILDPRLLDGYLGLSHVVAYAQRSSKGINLPRVSPQAINCLPVPLPPLPEQQRIAEKLESLLGKIREAKALLDEVPELLQNFRQTVLAAACSGRLTADWGGENPNVTPATKLLTLILTERRTKWEDAELAKLRAKGNEPKDEKWKKKYTRPAAPEIGNLPELPEKWVWTNIDQLAESAPNAIKAGPFGSTLKKLYYVPKGFKIYGQEQVIRDDPYYGDYYIDKERFKELSSCAVKPGDILVSLVGTIGRVLILPQDIEPGIINPRLVKLSLDNRLTNPFFIKYYFQSAFVKYLFSLVAHGGTMDILNLSVLKDIPIPLPPIGEQEEIFRRVESLFTKIDDLEKQYKEAMELIENLPEIILSKAFRGALVPQNPNDEPALELLDRVRNDGRNEALKTSHKRDHT